MDASLTQLAGDFKENQNILSRKEEGPVAAIQLQPDGDTIQDQEAESLNEQEPISIGRPLFLRSTTQTAFLVMGGSEKENAMSLRQLRDYKGCIILPDDGWFVLWSIFLIIMIVFSGIFTPLRVAFLEEDPLSMGVEWFLDTVFFVDTVLNFITAYFDRGESLVDKRRTIACNYLRSWFFVDLVSVLPLKLFFRHSITQMAKIARVHRVDRIIRTFKLLRMMKSSGRSKSDLKPSNTHASTSGELQGLTFYFIIFIVLCHNLACLWFWIAKLEGFGNNTWASGWTQYISAFYFIIATITTVGYGDFNAATEVEMIFCCVLMLIGVIAYSMSISALSSIIASQDQKAQQLKARLSILDRVRRQFGLKFEFYWRLRQSLHYDVDKDMTDKQQLLAQLPNKLRVELSTLMYREQLAGIHFFSKKSPHFIASVAPILRPVNLSKGQYVYMEGDPLDAGKLLFFFSYILLVYFIKSGETAYVQSKQKADLVFAVNKTGSYFGDIDFTLSNEEVQAKRAFSVKARTNVQLLVLQKQDLFNLDSQFKTEIMQLFSHAMQNYEALNEFVQKANRWYEFSNPQEKIEGITEEDFQDESNSVRRLYTSQGRLRQSESLYNSVKLHKTRQIGELINSGAFELGKQTDDYERGSTFSSKQSDSKKRKKKKMRPSLLKSSCSKKINNFSGSQERISRATSRELREQSKQTQDLKERMKVDVLINPESDIPPKHSLRLKTTKNSPHRSSGFLSPTSPQENRFSQFQFREYQAPQISGTDESDWEKQRNFLMEVLKNAKNPDFN